MSQHLDALGEKDDWRVLEVLGRYKRSYLVGGKMQSPTQLIERLGFEQRELTNFIKDLSGGQRRRLALLCVILEEPKRARARRAGQRPRHGHARRDGGTCSTAGRARSSWSPTTATSWSA